MAIFAVGKLIKPANGRIIDSLSDVKSKVESAMVASSEDQHEFSGFVLCLADFEVRIFFYKSIGVEEGGLVSQVLAAFAEMFWEEYLGLLLKDM